MQRSSLRKVTARSRRTPMTAPLALWMWKACLGHAVHDMVPMARSECKCNASRKLALPEATHRPRGTILSYTQLPSRGPLNPADQLDAQGCHWLRWFQQPIFWTALGKHYLLSDHALQANRSARVGSGACIRASGIASSTGSGGSGS